MALLEKKGFGQVEPNHLSAQRTGQIYAQLPLASDIEVLENGQFAVYDYASGEVNFTGKGEPLLVFNEVKLYELRQGCKDFALQKINAIDGELVPRLFKTNVGDIFTTNLVNLTTAFGDALVGLKVTPKDGVLTEKLTPTSGEIVFTIVKATTMADGQKAIKVQRTA